MTLKELSTSSLDKEFCDKVLEGAIHYMESDIKLSEPNNWYSYLSSDYKEFFICKVGSADVVAHFRNEEGLTEAQIYNAEVMAYSKDNVDYLIKKIRELQKENEKLKKRVEDFEYWFTV